MPVIVPPYAFDVPAIVRIAERPSNGSASIQRFATGHVGVVPHDQPIQGPTVIGPTKPLRPHDSAIQGPTVLGPAKPLSPQDQPIQGPTSIGAINPLKP